MVSPVRSIMAVADFVPWCPRPTSCGSRLTRTKNLQVAVTGTCIPLHHPLAIAEEVAMLDHLSNGRFIWGRCVVFRPNTCPTTSISGISGSVSGRFFLNPEALSSEGRFDFDGQFYRVRDYNIWPKPLQQPYPKSGWRPIAWTRSILRSGIAPILLRRGSALSGRGSVHETYYRLAQEQASPSPRILMICLPRSARYILARAIKRRAKRLKRI